MRRFWVVLPHLVLTCYRFGVQANSHLSDRGVTKPQIKRLATLLMENSRSGGTPLHSAARHELVRLRGGSLSSSATKTLAAQGDDVVHVVASCGAGIPSPAVSRALSAPQDVVSILPNDIPIVLYNVASASESDASIAVAAADVVVLEVRFDDLVRRTPHGLAQLRPLMKRLDATYTPKLVLIVVSDYDASEASEEDVKSFVEAEFAELIGIRKNLFDGAEPQVEFVPPRSSPGYERAISILRSTLITQAASFCSPAIASSEAIRQATERIKKSTTLSASPITVHDSYKTSILTNHAMRSFLVSAMKLEDAAEKGLMPDFGEQANKVMDQALATFDRVAGSTKAPSIASARKSLIEQMHRYIGRPEGSYRKQLSALQVTVINNFVPMAQTSQPTSDFPVRLKKMLKEAMQEFDATAKELLPKGASWSYSYERTVAKEYMENKIREIVEEAQMGGLYIDKRFKLTRIPIDVQLNWMALNPFGKKKKENEGLFR